MKSIALFLLGLLIGAVFAAMQEDDALMETVEEPPDYRDWDGEWSIPIPKPSEPYRWTPPPQTTTGAPCAPIQFVGQIEERVGVVAVHVP